MAFTSGEYLEKFILPALLHTLQNLKQDFLAVIPEAPERAIDKSGIIVHKVGQPISVDWDKADAYLDADLAEFEVENDTIPWQYFSTTPFMTDKEEIRTSALNRGGILVQKSSEAIVSSFIEKNLHNLAPDDDTDDVFNPVIETTGGDRGNGHKKMLLEDVIKFMEPFANMKLMDMSKLFMVLTVEHLTDLMLDALTKQAFRDMFIKTQSGEPIPHHGWKFFVNTSKVHYAADGTKKALGAAIGGTDVPASTAFYSPHTIKAIRNVTRHYKPMSEDTRNNPPRDELRFSGNGVVGKLWKVGFGAVKSGVVV